MMIFYSKKYYVLLCLFTACMLVTACSEDNSNESAEVETPEGDGEARAAFPREIIDEGASVSKVTTGYTFDTAGSPLYLEGALYFTNNNFDNPEVSRTLRKTSAGGIDTLRMDNGVTTTLRASARGTIFACEMLGHRVVELDTDGQVLEVIADSYNGNRIDGPNDLVVDQQGGLYFSDSQFIAGGEKKQETPAVYYVDVKGNITRVIDDIAFPNGLGLSPDGSTLYVANTEGEHLLAYNVEDDATLSNKRNFAAIELSGGSKESGADGVAVDRSGNVYVATTQGLGVQVFNSEGEHLGNIPAPTPTNNVSFGGEDGETLFISAQDGIYSIPVKTRGL